MQKIVPFSMAIESRYPEQIGLLIARDPQGRYNPMTIGWFMPASMKPPMLAVAVGQTRYSLSAIRASKAFVLSFLSEPQADIAKYCGTHSGRDLDKLAGIQCETLRAEKIDGRIVADAAANFECVVRQEMTAGDHVIFVGEVVCAHVNDHPLNRMFTLVRAEHLDGFRQRHG